MPDLDLSPSDFGAPPKFSSWRPGQDRAVLDAIESSARFVVQRLPTGAGKSLHVILQGLMTGRRICVLTETKGLQTQYLNDFRSAGLVDVRGQNNYDCLALMSGGEFFTSGNARRTCDEGPCHFGAKCSIADTTCYYYGAIRKAKQSQLVITNYSYWLSAAKTAMRRGGKHPLGDFDILLLDEADGSPDAVERYLAFDLIGSEVLAHLRQPLPDGHLDELIAWAGTQMTTLEERLEQLSGPIADGYAKKAQVQEARDFKELYHNVTLLSGLNADNWIMSKEAYGLKFDPIWVGDYTESLLFLKIPRAILVSATVTPKTMELLGVSEFDFFEYPSSFPVERRPIRHVKSVPVRFTMTSDEVDIWVHTIDSIISQRLDRKGIIPTVSFKRQKELLQRSRYREIMIGNTSMDTMNKVKQYRDASAPAILVSPSIARGWDFPGDQCEYLIISKLAFPDSSNSIVTARSKLDPEYPMYLAARDLVQSCGRGMRSETDSCEVFMVDDQVLWFISRWAKFIPKEFLEAYREKNLTIIPKPPPRLTKGGKL